jgi:hypothetical protein
MMVVLFHAMWKSGTPFKPTLGAARRLDNEPNVRRETGKE